MYSCRPLTKELYHHGIKGQKWGVRRYQNKDGSLTPKGKKRYQNEDGDIFLPKGTVVKRVSNNKADVTYDNKKYVSINQDDHSKWETYLGEEYIRLNNTTWNQTYKTTKDLRVMSSTKQGELFTKLMLEDRRFKKKALKDIAYSDRYLRQKPVDDAAENISRNIAAQTDTGKAFVRKVLALNYNALVDTHGTNVSKDPLIVLNPDTNLTRISEPEYTRPVKEYLKRMYGIAA